VVADFVFKNI
jgi:hypothetical protein